MQFITSRIDHHFNPHGPWTPGMLLDQKRTLMRDQTEAADLSLTSMMDRLGLEQAGEGRWCFDHEVNAAFVPTWVAAPGSIVEMQKKSELNAPEVEGLKEAARARGERKLISFSKPVTGYFGPGGLRPGRYEGGAIWGCSRRSG